MVVAAMGTDLEVGGLGGGGETSSDMRYVWTRVIVEEVVRMSRCRVIFFRVELTGSVDELDVGYRQTIHLFLPGAVPV